MNRKLRIMAVGALLSVSFVAGFINYRSTPVRGGAPATLAIDFKSLADLAQESSIVAEVKVKTNPRSFEYNTVLYSLNDVEVLRLIKGPEGATAVTVLDNGGVYKGREYGLGGAPLMHAGDHYLLFLKEYTGTALSNQPLTKQVYFIRGVWQGKLKVSADGSLEYVGPSDEQKELQSDIRSRKNVQGIVDLLHP